MADEEERKLCAEILKNWNTPTPISSEMMHRNPFSHFDVEEMNKCSSKRKKHTEMKSMDIIPILVGDTFYDKLLGHATDGINIAALVSDAPTTVSPTQPKQTHNGRSSCFNLSSQCNIPTVNTSGGYGAKKTASRTESSIMTPLDFVRKLVVMLYSNKTINTDDFGDKMRNPGADTTDFFNYGLDETQWKDYCRQMHALIHRPTKTNAADTIEDGEIVEW